MQYWCHRKTPGWNQVYLKEFNFYMERDRISTEPSTEIYSQFMVMLQLKTKHQSLGKWTSPRYNPAETAAFGHLHYSGGQHSPELSLATGVTQVLWLRETSCISQRDFTTRWSSLRAKNKNPKNPAPDTLKHPKTILLIHLLCPVPFPQSHQFTIF